MIDYSTVVPKQNPLPTSLLTENLEPFFDYCEIIRDCLPSTREAYRTDLRVLERFLEEKGLQQISFSVVCDFIAYLKNEKHNAPVTVQRKLASLTAFFDYLVVMQLLDERDHPMLHLPKLKNLTDKKLPVVLSESEMHNLLDAVPSDTVQGIRDKAILMLFYSTGMRVAELCALHVCDVDFEARKILVHGKGERERFVPLIPAAEAAVQQWLQYRPALDNDFLFVSKKKNGISKRAVQALVDKYAKAAGIEKKISPHKLRHTCATHLLHSGVNLPVIADLLGHQDLRTTRIYLHVTLQEVTAALAYHPLWLLHNFQPVEVERDRRKLTYQGKYQKTA